MDGGPLLSTSFNRSYLQTQRHFICSSFGYLGGHGRCAGHLFFLHLQALQVQGWNSSVNLPTSSSVWILSPQAASSSSLVCRSSSSKPFLRVEAP
ncbi:hypothetical protein INR49_020825 [Caranx melampygus]|nr:hypothetical protein INR49_020825 [Caranx melampygus]